LRHSTDEREREGLSINASLLNAEFQTKSSSMSEKSFGMQRGWIDLLFVGLFD
jgi:hypothetical protein